MLDLAAVTDVIPGHAAKRLADVEFFNWNFRGYTMISDRLKAAYGAVDRQLEIDNLHLYGRLLCLVILLVGTYLGANPWCPGQRQLPSSKFEDIYN